MLVTKAYAKVKKLPSLITLKVIGGKNHGQYFDVVDERSVDNTEIDGENVLGMNVRLRSGNFQLVPRKQLFPGEKDRDTWYITGPSNIGKTVFASKLAKQYKRQNPRNKLIWITPIPDCDELLALNPIIINMSDPEKVYLNFYDEDEKLRIINNPSSPNEEQSSDLQDSMIIFDDIDASNDPKLSKLIYETLVNPALLFGRHFGITVVVAKHITADYSKTRTILQESEYITIFPRYSAQQPLRHLMKYYLGLSNDTMSDILSSHSRSVTFHNRYPFSIITDDTYELIQQ